jgi:hypothetical protein
MKVEKAESVHLVHYLIRDDFSGVFYAEIHSGSPLIPVEEFLFRAWSQKENYGIYGEDAAEVGARFVDQGLPILLRCLSR